MSRPLVLAVLGAVIALLSVGYVAFALGDDAGSNDGDAAGIVEEGDPTPDGPAGGTSPALGDCLPDVVDCDDTVTTPDTADTDFGDEPSLEDQAAAAPELLGVAEADLSADVRVSRRGEENLFLTEDYVLGRLTVELDDDGTGTFRVTSVTIELPEGPETFTG